MLKIWPWIDNPPKDIKKVEIAIFNLNDKFVLLKYFKPEVISISPEKNELDGSDKLSILEKIVNNMMPSIEENISNII